VEYDLVFNDIFLVLNLFRRPLLHLILLLCLAVVEEVGLRLGLLLGVIFTIILCPGPNPHQVSLHLFISRFRPLFNLDVIISAHLPLFILVWYF